MSCITQTRKFVIGGAAALGMLATSVNMALPRAPDAETHARINLSASVMSTFQGYQGTVYSFPLPAGTIGVTGLTGTVSISTSTLPRYPGNPSQALFIVGYLPSGGCVTNGFQFQDFFQTFFLAYPNAVWVAKFIVKNLGSGVSTVSTKVDFPAPIPVSGCAFVIIDGGPSLGYLKPISSIRMVSSMKLNYGPPGNQPAPYIVGSGDEFCFGMSWGCQMSTPNKGVAFAAVDKIQRSGRLVSLYGNVSEGGLSRPAGYWSARNGYYLDRACSQFPAAPPAGQKLYGPGSYFDTIPLAATRLLDFTLSGTSNVLQQTVNSRQNVTVSAGDCLVHIVQVNGPGHVDGAGQVDAENQVLSLIQP